MTTDGQKTIRAAADWVTINEESRVTIPSEITDCLNWFNSKKRMPICLDLSRPQMIVIWHLPEVTELLRDRRQMLLEDTENEELGIRRAAMTYHFFREANLVVPERRIGLKAVVLDHLGTKPGGKLFCLGYGDRIEIYNELAAHELILRHASNLVIDQNP